MATIGALSAPATTNHTSRAGDQRAKPIEIRVGGGFGQPCTPTTSRSSCARGRLREDRRGVPLGADPEQQHVEGRHVLVGGRRRHQLVGVAGGGGVRVVAVRAARGAHRVHARRVEVEVVEQRLPGLPLVAVGVVGGHEALVAPPHVDPAPVDARAVRGTGARTRGRRSRRHRRSPRARPCRAAPARRRAG
jgi:hypothetical protein